MEYNPVRHSSAEIERFVKEELPGVDFKVEDFDSIEATIIKFRHRVEGYDVAVDNVRLYSRFMNEEFHHTIRHAIDTLRQKAIKDYGLQKKIDEEKAQAFIAGFDAMVKNLKNYIDKNMREQVSVVVDDPDDGPYFDTVPGSLTPQGQKLHDWLETLKVPKHK